MYVYQVIRDKGGFENWDMIQVEEYKSTNKKDLESRERYWIETLKSSLNKMIPTRTHKEYREDNKDKIILKKKSDYEKNKETILLKQKNYRDNNKDVIKLRKKEYYENNKESIELKRKEKGKYTCECGLTLTIAHKPRHERTQKHQKYLSEKISKV